MIPLFISHPLRKWGWVETKNQLSVCPCQKGTKAIFKNEHMVAKRRTQVMGYGLTSGPAWSTMSLQEVLTGTTSIKASLWLWGLS